MPAGLLQLALAASGFCFLLSKLTQDEKKCGFSGVRSGNQIERAKLMFGGLQAAYSISFIGISGSSSVFRRARQKCFIQVRFFQ